MNSNFLASRVLAQSLPSGLPSVQPPVPLDPRFESNANQPYLLDAGDQLFIEVQRFPDLSIANVTITPEGTIVMPLIGTVVLKGLTLEQAQETIHARLNQFVIDPVIRVSLLVQRPVQVTVTGAVARPGFYPLSVPQIFAAITAAQGTTTAADLRSVEVRRRLPSNHIISQTLDLLTPLQTGNAFPNLRLQDGDVIVVPSQVVGGYNPSDLDLATRYSLAAPSQPVKITITGAITRPGFYTLPPSNNRISDALLVAGGVSTNADLRSVQVHRILADGSVYEKRIDLYTPLINAAALPEVPLEEGDTIVVPELSPDAAADYNRTLVATSTLAKPQITVRVLSYASGGLATVFLPNGSTFADALNGVPLDAANLDEVALVRFDPEQGKAVKREINGKDAILGDMSQNVLLQDNDVIIIGRNLIARVGYVLNTVTKPFRDILGFVLFFQQLKQGVENLFGPGNSTNRR